MNWNLSALYTSFTSEDFLKDFDTLESLVPTLNDWSMMLTDPSINPTMAMEAYIEHAITLRTLSSKLGTFASLSFATDSKNTEALKYLDKLRKVLADFTLPMTLFQKYIKGLSDDVFDATIEGSDTLKIHAFHLRELKLHANYMLSDQEEVLLAKMKQTGSSAWATLQNKVTSDMMVTVVVDGEEKSLPLQAARNLAFNADPETRKLAYEAELKAYEAYDEVSAAVLNAIKGEVITESDLRGFTSPLEKTLFDARMSQETLDAMMAAIKDALPTLRQYLKRKGQVLGHKNGLPFYDMFAPLGGDSKEVTVDEAKAMVLENFYNYSSEMGDFAKKAFEQAWLDILPKEGKRGGAFCSNIPAIKESRFLLNFTGYLKNVITMAHELGHGYHGQQIFSESILNTTYPMPLAETASIFCETILQKSVLEKASDEEALSIVEASVQGYGQLIVDIYSRYLFETALFEQRKDASLSPKELNELMITAQKEAYGDGLDHDVLHPYMWMNKTHYYSAGRNFYNFPYAFGLLFAKGLYRKYLEMGDDFKDKYNALLKETGKNSIEAVAALMDIDVTDQTFWASSLAEIGEEVDVFMKLTNDLMH